MKLAREIAEAVYREQKEVRDRFGIELIEPVVAGIIAPSWSRCGLRWSTSFSILRRQIATAHTV